MFRILGDVKYQVTNLEYYISTGNIWNSRRGGCGQRSKSPYISIPFYVKMSREATVIVALRARVNTYWFCKKIQNWDEKVLLNNIKLNISFNYIKQFMYKILKPSMRLKY